MGLKIVPLPKYLLTAKEKEIISGVDAGHAEVNMLHKRDHTTIIEEVASRNTQGCCGLLGGRIAQMLLAGIVG